VPEARELHVKGLAFTSVLASVRRLRGADGLNRLLGQMPTELREKIQYGYIVKGGWYPAAWYKQLLRAIVESTGEGRDLIRQVGAECSRQDLTGIYRVFARLLSPQTLFSGAMRLFKSYYDGGEVWIVKARPGAAQAIWRNCHGFDQNMWDEVLGSVTAILELGGATDVRLRIVMGGGDGDSDMEASAYWNQPDARVWQNSERP
jgi:hypothetical protein